MQFTLPAQVLAAEKELMLAELNLKEVRKELDTEKACYSKSYDDVSQLLAVYGHTCISIQREK